MIVTHPFMGSFAHKNAGSLSVERRSKPRIYVPFPAEVQGINANGQKFETETALDDLSANGLCLRLTHQVDAGAELVVIFRLSASVLEAESAARVKVRGTVLRIEQKSSDVYGVALTFKHPQFL